MSNCDQRIRKEQLHEKHVTECPDEFCNFNGTKTDLVADDKFLIEDSEDSLNKKCTTLQDICDFCGDEIGVPVYGSVYECEQNEDVDIIVCPTATVVISLTTAVLPAGTYKISWSYFWNCARLRQNFNSQVILDGTVERTHVQVVSEVDDPEFDNTCNDQQIPVSGFFKRVFETDTTHTIEIKVFTDSTGYQCSIWDKMIDILRVS